MQPVVMALLTGTSAAVYIMRVPEDQLAEALQALHTQIPCNVANAVLQSRSGC